MSARDRNPYVALGIEFGASRDEANLAFARRARPLKRSGAHDALVELTWALNQIDEAIVRPEIALEFYRVPADPEAFNAASHGLFAPAPELLGRRADTSERDLASLEDLAGREILAAGVMRYAARRRLPEA